MFLLRGELACLRDLPNIRGDYYRQTPEGGGGILIYRVYGNHIMVDWQNIFDWYAVCRNNLGVGMLNLFKSLCNISPHKIFLVCKNECGGSVCPLQSLGVDTWANKKHERGLKAVNNLMELCYLFFIQISLFWRLDWVKLLPFLWNIFIACWDYGI